MPSSPRTSGNTLRTVSLLLAAFLTTALANAASTGFPDEPSVTLLGLVQTYDGEPKPVTVFTDPPNLAVALLYDGSVIPPTEPGSYTVLGVILDPIFPVVAKDILTISPAVTNITAPAPGTYRAGQTLEFS